MQTRFKLKLESASFWK